MKIKSSYGFNFQSFRGSFMQSLQASAFTKKSKCFVFFEYTLLLIMNSLKGSCFYIWFQDWIMIAVLKSVPKIGCYQIVWGGVNKTEDSSPPTLLTRIMIRLCYEILAENTNIWQITNQTKIDTRDGAVEHFQLTLD